MFGKIFWLGRRDSNPDLQEPKSCVLPIIRQPKKEKIYSHPELNRDCWREKPEF